jgi:hypothetical protein
MSIQSLNLNPIELLDRAIATSIKRDILSSPEFEQSQVLDISNMPDGTFTSGLATTSKQQLDRLIVATQRYLEEGYLKDLGEAVSIEGILPESLFDMSLDQFSSSLSEADRARFMHDGVMVRIGDLELYVDKWLFEDTIPIVGYEKKDGKVVPTGSVRLILPKRERDIPLFDNQSIAINPEQLDSATLSQAELSQLAILKGSTRGMASALLRKAVEVGRKLNLLTWAAVIDGREIQDDNGQKQLSGVLGLLNGSAYAFGLPSIGPSVYHVGSDTTPVLIDVDQALYNAEFGERKTPSSVMASQFIRGIIRFPNYMDKGTIPEQ